MPSIRDTGATSHTRPRAPKYTFSTGRTLRLLGRRSRSPLAEECSSAEGAAASAAVLQLHAAAPTAAKVWPLSARWRTAATAWILSVEPLQTPISRLLCDRTSIRLLPLSRRPSRTPAAVRQSSSLCPTTSLATGTLASVVSKCGVMLVLTPAAWLLRANPQRVGSCRS